MNRPGIYHRSLSTLYIYRTLSTSAIPQHLHLVIVFTRLLLFLFLLLLLALLAVTLPSLEFLLPHLVCCILVEAGKDNVKHFLVP